MLLFSFRMKLVKQIQRFSTSNFSPVKEKSERRHSTLLPNIIRAAICGPSGCGKTNLMIGLLLNPNGLKFKNVYLFGKTLHQPKYQYLKRVINLVPEIKLYDFEDAKELPQEVETDSVCIFDDVTMENQDTIKRYFSYGRHMNLDCFYLTQSYVCIPRHLIRCNFNFLIVFPQDELNLKHIYDEHVSTPDLSFTLFKDMCSLCWKDPFGYLVIDKTRDSNHGRFRKGLDTFIMDI